jgi:hypothetical protein
MLLDVRRTVRRRAGPEPNRRETVPLVDPSGSPASQADRVHCLLVTPNRFVREITTFVRDDDQWRRDDERHENVLIDTSAVPALLAEHGVQAIVAPSVGSDRLPVGLFALIGRRVA